jgi:hypothetical protein
VSQHGGSCGGAPLERPCMRIIMRRRFSFSYTNCTSENGSGRLTSHRKKSGPRNDEMKSSLRDVAGFGISICDRSRAAYPSPENE